MELLTLTAKAISWKEENNSGVHGKTRSQICQQAAPNKFVLRENDDPIPTLISACKW